MALSLTVAESLAARLRSELFLRLLRRDGLFFDAVRTGQMASWLGQDVEVLEVRRGDVCVWRCCCLPVDSRMCHVCFGGWAAACAAPCRLLAWRCVMLSPSPTCCPANMQTTMAKLLGARGIRSAFETVGIIVVLFSLSPLLAATLLVSAPLLTPLIARLTGRIGGASKAAQVCCAWLAPGLLCAPLPCQRTCT